MNTLSNPFTELEEAGSLQITNRHTSLALTAGSSHKQTWMSSPVTLP